MNPRGASELRPQASGKRITWCPPTDAPEPVSVAKPKAAESALQGGTEVIVKLVIQILMIVELPRWASSRPASHQDP